MIQSLEDKKKEFFESLGLLRDGEMPAYWEMGEQEQVDYEKVENAWKIIESLVKEVERDILKEYNEFIDFYFQSSNYNLELLKRSFEIYLKTKFNLTNQEDKQE